MGFSDASELFVWILVFTLIIHFTSGAEVSTTSAIGVGQPEDEGEQFEKNLQNNFQTGVGRILEFFDSVTGNLSKIHERFDELERKGEERHDELKEIALRLRNAEEHLNSLPKINKRMDDLERVGNERYEELKQGSDSMTGNLSKTNKKISDLERVGNERYAKLTILRAEEYLRILPPVKKGNTFQGSTIEAISAVVPTKFALTVQIVNYLDTPLQDYKLHLTRGEVFNEAPQTVPAKTREVFTFKQDPIFEWSKPWGAFSYKLGNRNFELHLYFVSDNFDWVATAFLPRDSAVDTIYGKPTNWREKPVDWPYEHTGVLELGTVKTTTIHKDRIYAKVTLQAEAKTKVKVEIFRFVP